MNKEKLLDIYYPIRRRIIDVYYSIRYIPHFIWKVINYLPILWKDRDWDYMYILLLLQYKIKRSRLEVTKDMNFTAAPRVIRQMKHAEFLLNRIIENDYFKEEAAVLEERFGRIIFVKEDIEHPFFGKCFTGQFTGAKCITEEDKKLEREAHRQLWEKQEATLKKDYERLFRHLNRFVTRWWS